MPFAPGTVALKPTRGVSARSRPRRGAFTLPELLIGLLLLLTLTGLGLTWWKQLVRRARRAEVAPAVQGIMLTQAVRAGVHEEVVDAPLHPRPLDALDRAQAPWLGTPEWERLGWRPDGAVYASYVTGKGAPKDLPGTLLCVAPCAFAVGLTDLDDDGELYDVAQCSCFPGPTALRRSVALPAGERF